MKSIELKDEPTPRDLAKALGKPVGSIISELKDAGERGIFTVEIDAESPLAWGVAERACERAQVGLSRKPEPEGQVTLTKDEWEFVKRIAKAAAGFTRSFGEIDSITTGRVDPARAKEILEDHKKKADEIENLIKMVEKKREPAMTPGL
jgi:hypothetical protein